jgi:hypothetical protein|tara:strand:+ start:230 stop:433 length:204 start_codon:yes stop_codon:yes gene_type:complete
MKLAEYLTDNSLTQKQFIKNCEDKTGHKFSQGGLSKYILEIRTPRKKEMLVINEITKGKVQPNDFYL